VTPATACGPLTNVAAVATTNGGSDSTSATIGVRCDVQISQSAGACAAFNAGTAASSPSAHYSLKKNRINQVDPGVLGYWLRVNVPAGANSVVISQAVASGNVNRMLTLAPGSAVYDATCTKVRTSSITSSGGSSMVTFTASHAATYLIGLKYSLSPLVGAGAPAIGTLGDYRIRFQFFASGAGVPSNSTVSLDVLLK
jgi:hypothetical protein